ncbi:MAG: hypothetical protein HBSAPP02_03760 [Phycisphaerae bacterium]|nr:MAG: hypothetical protein HRU71_11590 [Planctomycetia bacterium]RIK66485.1 MAG: hypothetical protein DCC66_13035 [Planctomycetota bacterium]GJQ25344.1 MAG: hypothetical protein HBSAPP02_03760 [Phycisphaerae bacterium]
MTPRRMFEWMMACLVVFVLVSSDALQAEQITGYVLRQGDFAPIAGAKVTLQATTTHVFTQADGSFTLPVRAGTERVIVGAAKGYFNAGVTLTPPASGVQIFLEPVPQDDDPAYAFREPIEACGFCHPNQFNEWNDSPMARGGLNTWVHDIYNGMGTPGGLGGFVYTRDSIYAPTNPNSECASCHQPESWIPAPFSRMEGPQDPNYPSPAAAHGISCSVCHKVANVDVSRIDFPGIFPGAVLFTRPAGQFPNEVMYGMLGDATYNVPTLMRPSYQPQLAAEVCGACHQDRSDPDENHTYTGPISEPTYTEWAQSPYSDPQSPMYANCITCHMPPTEHTTLCEVIWPPLERQVGTIRSHDIRGTTPLFLENAVSLGMTTSVVDSELTVNVTLTNTGTGHHVPTGVTTRNMILLVEAWPDGGDPITDLLPLANGPTVHILGGVGNPAQGHYGGRPGKLYAKVPHDAQNNFPAFFTDATGNIFDNRIAALESDATQYTFSLPQTSGDVRVRARLLYRRAWRALVDAKQWTQDGHGNPLSDVAPPHYGYLMEMAETAVPNCAEAGSGDVNGDGLLNGADVGGFVDLLLNHSLGPAGAAFCAANMQPDAVLNGDDLVLFVAAMLKQ